MHLGDARPASLGKRLDWISTGHGLAQDFAIIPRAHEQGVMSHQPTKIGIAPSLVKLAERITAAPAVKRRPPLEVKHAGIDWGVGAQPLARRVIPLEARIDRSHEI